MFSFKQTVHFPDVDHAGIAFFGALLTYCHYAHEEWLKMLGHPLHDSIKHGWGFPIVGVKSTFFSPAHHGDILRIDLTLLRLGNSSLKLQYDIQNETQNWPVGKAVITQVCSDIEEMKAIPVPTTFRQAVERWLGTPVPG